MPVKKDVAANGAMDSNVIMGFDGKETKLLAAAFISSTGPDKFDYDLMATLTGNTAGSLKKMMPPIKRKAIAAHPSFAAYLGETKAAAPKVTAGKKRKTPDDEGEANGGDIEEPKPKKKAPAKGRGRPKKVKKEETPDIDEDEGKNENGDASQDNEDDGA